MVGRVNPARAIAFFALSCATWLGATGAGCTDGTTPVCTSPESGCGPGFDGPPPETAPSDAASEEASEATPDATPDVAPDATPDVTPDVAPDVPQDAIVDAPSSEAGVPCHKFTGSDASLECSYEPNAKSCAGEKPGSCPAKNLGGCCVAANGSATCYYDADIPPPAAEMVTCLVTLSNTWVTTPP